MPLSHRPVEEQDLPTLCGLAQDAEELFFFFPKARFPLTPAQLQENIAQRADSTVVLLEGQVVGLANFYRWESGGQCWIGNVIVAPSARGRGVARYLIGCLVEKAHDHHQASAVHLSCFNHNTAGLLLYSSLGFEPYAIEPYTGPQGQRLALIQLRWRCSGL
ncbi:MAG: GNAT family N-acetyltransferase [Pseudomonas sp.]|uniref:GNAT family N-acetyltransferase n=1 Tax=Pseudomonas sp. TaxID=306 RepID=UPI003390CDE0